MEEKHGKIEIIDLIDQAKTHLNDAINYQDYQAAAYLSQVILNLSNIYKNDSKYVYQGTTMFEWKDRQQDFSTKTE